MVLSGEKAQSCLAPFSPSSFFFCFVFASPVGGSGVGVGGQSQSGVESWRSAGGDAVRGLTGGTSGSLLDPAATVRKGAARGISWDQRWMAPKLPPSLHSCSFID